VALVEVVQDFAGGPAGDLGELVEQDSGQRGQSGHHLGQPSQRIQGDRGVAERPVHGLVKTDGAASVSATLQAVSTSSAGGSTACSS
jgi:hypothetical protein